MKQALGILPGMNVAAPDRIIPEAPVDVPLCPPTDWFHQKPRDPDAPEWVRDYDPRDGLIQIQLDGPEAGRFVALVAPEGEQILHPTLKFQPHRSPTNYEFAHAGTTVCADGSKIRTANIGGNINHAPPSWGMTAAVDLYANTATRTMRGRYHDVPGVGVVAVGALWPGLTVRDAITAMGMAISGDWRPVASLGQRDLAGSQLVNAPALRPLPHGVERDPAYQPMRFTAIAASLDDGVVYGEWTPDDIAADRPLSDIGGSRFASPMAAVPIRVPSEWEMRLGRIEAAVAVLVANEVQEARLHPSDDEDEDDGDYDDIMHEVYGCKACHGTEHHCNRCGGTRMEPYDPMSDMGYDVTDEFADDDEAMVAALSTADDVI